MKKIYFFFLFAFSTLSIFSWNCSKTYTFSPASPVSSTATPTATATTVCALPQPLTGTPPSGIIIYGAVLSGQAYGTPQEEAVADLLVNGSPISTAAVTLSGPGFSAPLTYNSTSSINGNTYALYEYASSGVSLTVGDTYTLTASASGSTASASGILPPMPTVALDGSGGSWTGPSQFNFGLVNAVVSVSQTFYQTDCVSAGSMAIPASAYPSSQNYVIEFGSDNYTTAITGGQGYLLTNSLSIIEISK